MRKHSRVKHGENLTESDKGACMPRNEDIPHIRLVIARAPQARKLGADAVINYKTQDFAREIRTLTNRRGVDVVVDSVGGDSYSQSLASLVKGGRLVTCGATAGPRPQTDLQRIFWNQLSVFGSTMGNRREFAEMLNFVRKRGVKPVIDQVLPLAEGAQAFARMEEGKQFGKIVLKVGDSA